MSAQTWRTEASAYGVILVVNHVCGHKGCYLYGGEEFAQRDTGTQQAEKCVPCWNSAEVARLTAELAKHSQNLTTADVAPDSETTP